MANDFEGVSYLPLVALKPAEMNAIENMPEQSKDLLCPTFFLKRWSSSHNLDSSVARIEQAFGNRRCIVELGLHEEYSGARQHVHDELDDLRDPGNGFLNWCEFVEQHPNFVPALQLSSLENLTQETACLNALGRGIVLRFPQLTFQFVSQICQQIAAVVNDSSSVLVIIDFERESQDILGKQAQAVGLLNSVREHLPNCYLSISATSFPESFTDLERQGIYERLLFNGIAAQGFDRFIYSDRGSARARSLGGGGGNEIPPRIDCAAPTSWTFYRADPGTDKSTGYQEQAENALDSDEWDADLMLWGTQLIQRTALGDTSAINSQATAAAARINIHLMQQLYYDDPDGLYDNDDDWDD